MKIATIYRLVRLNELNDVQLIKIADALGDIAQIVFGTFFIPLFFGQVSFWRAFFGGLIACMLWFFGIILLTLCRK